MTTHTDVKAQENKLKKLLSAHKEYIDMRMITMKSDYKIDPNNIDISNPCHAIYDELRSMCIFFDLLESQTGIEPVIPRKI